MTPFVQMLLLTTLAGLAMPAGALIACVEHIHPNWLEKEFRHSVIALGGGVLFSAVALVLVPEGSKELSLWWAGGLFLLGGGVFYVLDRLLEQMNGSASQLIAMLSDFIPEAIALGAAFAVGKSTGLLLALLIALQNLPEGFNAHRELVDSTQLTAKRIVVMLLCLAVLGPASGLVGFYLLAGHKQIVSGIMLIAAGGILYLTFQDLAPQARLTNRNAPALGAVVGFLLGLMGHMVISP